jgi:hypothetical protein
MADSIEKQLLNSASHTAAYDRTSWKRWIVQLGDDNYARRQAADRALRAANPAFLVYLQQIDLNRLDAEQQFRLQRIRDSLAEKINNDSPEHVANWLSGDPGIWLALLSRSDVAARRIAAKQLAAILEGPIPVDPEAEPATQKDHFERLRSKIESLKKQD